jgi:hypothetical protein
MAAIASVSPLVAATPSKTFPVVALAFCFVAGYFLASLWPSARDRSLLAQICARVDYVNACKRISKDRKSQARKYEPSLGR